MSVWRRHPGLESPGQRPCSPGPPDTGHTLCTGSSQVSGRLWQSLDTRSECVTTWLWILTAHVTEEVWSVETSARYGEGSDVSETEDELTAQTPSPSEGPALWVSVAGGALIWTTFVSSVSAQQSHSPEYQKTPPEKVEGRVERSPQLSPPSSMGERTWLGRQITIKIHHDSVNTNHKYPRTTLLPFISKNRFSESFRNPNKTATDIFRYSRPINIHINLHGIHKYNSGQINL